MVFEQIQHNSFQDKTSFQKLGCGSNFFTKSTSFQDCDAKSESSEEECVEDLLCSKPCLKLLSQKMDSPDWSLFTTPFGSPPPMMERATTPPVVERARTPPVEHKLSYCCSDEETEEESPVISPFAFEGYDYKYENPFPKLPEKDTSYEDDKRFELVGAIWDGEDEELPVSTIQDEVVTFHQNLNDDERFIPSESPRDDEMLMVGTHIIVQGGELSGCFGLIESCHVDYCRVKVFLSKVCQIRVLNVSNRFLTPIVPDQDMKMTVEFMEHAEVYFCPRRAIPLEEDSKNKYSWVGMKTWCVMNPILKQAIPEGSALEKINDFTLKETLEFQEIQEIMDKLEPPYSLTFQFPSGVQQIKMDELYTDEDVSFMRKEKSNSVHKGRKTKKRKYFKKKKNSRGN